MRPELREIAALCGLLLVVPLGCGSTDKAAPNPAPDVAGGGQIGAGSGGQQTGVGGSSSAGANAAGGSGAMLAGNSGSAGANAASAGTSGLSAACGGELAGAWTARQEPTVVEPPTDVDACFDLALQRNAEQVFSQVWLDYHTVPRTVAFNLSPLAAGGEGDYFLTQYFDGHFVLAFAASCLLDDTQTRATCSELAASFNNSGMVEGWYSNVVCSAPAGGGCSCDFEIHQAGGFGGKWSPAPKDATVVVLKRPNPKNFMVVETFEVPYCVKDGALGLGNEIDKVLASTSQLSFAPVDCQDGVEGPGERGPDCGGACAKQCP